MSPQAQAALSEGNQLFAGGRVPEAIHAFRRAIGHDERFPAAHYNLGLALRRARDWRGAALAFRAAARLDPGDFDAMQNVVATLREAVLAGERPFQVPVPATSARPPAAVSIVVCSVDAARLARMRASFETALAGRTHEFVVIGDAASLAEGYTRGLDACRHEWVVFAHDDLEIVSPGAFEALEAAMEQSDVVGLAGSRRVTGPAVLWGGHPHLHGWVAYPVRDAAAWDATVLSLDCGVLGGMQALDGLLLATRREVARRVGFDARTFDGFHFYDLDFTYRAFTAGLRLAVTTGVTMIHASEGDFGADWQRYAERFKAKFPKLDAPAGPHHSYNARFESRAPLAAFYDAVRGLGAVA